MFDGRTVIYTYDGSLDGLFSCVFECFLRHEEPLDIQPEDCASPVLYDVRHIPTDPERARRVRTAIPRKISAAAARSVQVGFLYGEGGREMAILRFLQTGFQQGRRTDHLLADHTVNGLLRMVRAVENEAHLLKGFLRFSDHGGTLTAVIDPKHAVLPLLRGHFSARYPNESFLIYDRTHGAALIHLRGQCRILPVEALELPDPAEDAFYCALWKDYYDTIAIAERENPVCRRTHMPKRFWSNMPEVADRL